MGRGREGGREERVSYKAVLTGTFAEKAAKTMARTSKHTYIQSASMQDKT